VSRTLGGRHGDGSDLRHCVLTLVERKAGYAIIKKLRARNKDRVTRAIRRHCRKFKTLTLDNGTEFHGYAVLEERFPVKVYFATPYHSWERGSNENFNGPLRQCLPKGTCMRAVTQAQCDHIADDLNNRPRKRFGFDTPATLYHRK
jgi:transposase, IS30 family